jgi:tetratricopeptide (TPR) repeat protein
VPANAVLAVLFLGLLNAHTQFASQAHRFRLPLVGRIALLIGALGIAGWMVAEGLPLAREAVHLEAAKGAAHFDHKTDALRRALAIRPDNSETWYDLGELYRSASWRGESTYAAEAEEAATCFRKSSALNPYDPYSQARLGMCLDWLGRTQEASPCFDRALALDPNNHHLRILSGWHRLQIADYAGARREFARSLQLLLWPNPLAANLLRRTERLLREQQSELSTPRVGQPPNPRLTAP